MHYPLRAAPVRTRFVLVAATVLSILVGGSLLVSHALAGDSDRGDALFASWQTPPPPERAPETPPPAVVAPPAATAQLDVHAEVSVEVEGFVSWAVLDRTSSELASEGQGSNTTESMIKPWLVADHLRSITEDGQEPNEEDLRDARAAIRDSDDGAAERLYAAGGRDEVVLRMIDMCGLADTEIHPSWWSRTTITAVDAVLLGECLVDGTAAGPEWTGWVLEQMRHARDGDGVDGGRWGVIDGLPPAVDGTQISIKNGWTRIGDTDSWHVNCLALTPQWVLAVLMRYPAGYSLDYGAQRCAHVAAQLFDTTPVPGSPPAAR